MAYVEKRDGYYRIRVSDGFDPVTGKRRFKNFNWTPPPNMSERQISEELKRQEDEKQHLGDKWIDSGMVFTQANGNPIHPSTISKWLNNFCKRRGLPHISPHMLRHTSATLLLMQGLPLKAVSGRLGHSQTATTSDIYGHCLQSVDEIAADALGDILLKKDDDNQ